MLLHAQRQLTAQRAVQVKTAKSCYIHSTTHITSDQPQAPSDHRRRQVAKDILKVLAGQHLDDQTWVAVRSIEHILSQTSGQALLHFPSLLPALRNITAKILKESNLRSCLHFQACHQPPYSWAKLAAAAARSGPAAVEQHLSSHIVQVPDIDGATACRCQLTMRPFARRFFQRSLNAFLASIFHTIATSTPFLPQRLPVTLSRFDLYHAHMFQQYSQPYALGLLFHAMEYPAYSDAWPINLGYCQTGSKLKYDARGMELRNWIWYQGMLCCMDLQRGSCLYDSLLMDGLQDTHTIDENDFGTPVCDINYFGSLKMQPQNNRLFVCR